MSTRGASRSKIKSGHPMSRMRMINYTHKTMHKCINALIKALCSPNGRDDANAKEMRRVVKKILDIVKMGFDAMAGLAKEVK